MRNDSVGWAAGARKGTTKYPIILKTTNSGKIWKTKFEGSLSIDPETSIFFTNEDVGWMVGEYVTYKTTDGGENWVGAGSAYTDLISNNFYFIDGNTGWKADDKIYKTTDGGSSWLEKSGTGGNTVHFSDINNGWVCGQGGMIMNSTDGGENWSNQNSGITENLNVIRFYDSNIGMCAGDNGTILTTSDGGYNWIVRNTGTAVQINSIQFINSATVMANGFLFTTDGGNSWEELSNGYHFTNKNVGWSWSDNNIFKYSEEPTQPEIHFTKIWSGNPYLAMNIFITSAATINGIELNAGDEIGVFDGDNCVGSVLLTAPITPGGYVQVLASADDPSTPGLDGFITEHSISYRFWLSATSEEITDYTVNYSSGSGIFESQGSATVEFTDVLPVELVSFTADVNDNKVQLNWQTATELNNYGFEIERSINDNEFTKLGFVEGNGNSNSPKYYSFTDTSPFDGAKFQYRLKQIDTGGKYEYSNKLDVEIVPTKFDLYQNYPNPFNPVTKIRYQLPIESKVLIKIYDLLGAEVKTLINERREAGVYEIELNAQNLASGTYIYRIVAGDPSAGSGQSFVDTKKMLLMK